MTDDKWYTNLEKTHEAVRGYARIELEGLIRRVIYRLQRIDASGIYGDDYAAKSLWDEWCHEVQVGPHDLLDNAWAQTLCPILEDVINSVPRHAAVLLSVFAAWELDEDNDPSMIGSFWPDGIRRVLQDHLDQQARFRRLDHLGPWKNG